MNNSMMHKAIVFATMAHKGQVRKGTEIDYISHPMEVLQILTAICVDEELQIAGILHDVVEDTKYKIEDIRELFGDDVAELVASHTEKDKKELWKVRKQRALKELERSSFRMKVLAFADKLANMRSIAADYAEEGDKVWERFNARRQDIEWYYSTAIDCFYDFQLEESLAPYYWELNKLYKDVFINYYVDEEKGTLYQLRENKTGWYLLKGNPEWKVLEDEKMSDKAIMIEREAAESLEDAWNMEFWQGINENLLDADFEVYSSTDRKIEVHLCDGTLCFEGEYWGGECEVINGKDEYEYRYLLDENNTKRFVAKLRIEKGLKKPLHELFSETFGNESGSILFRKYLEDEKIVYTFWCY